MNAWIEIRIRNFFHLLLIFIYLKSTKDSRLIRIKIYIKV